MFWIIIIIIIAAFVWFFYTDRKATMEVTGTVVGTSAAAIGMGTKYVVANARAVKAKNDYESVIAGKTYDTSVSSHYHKTFRSIDKEFGYRQAIAEAEAKELEYKQLLNAVTEEMAKDGMEASVKGE